MNTLVQMPRIHVKARSICLCNLSTSSMRWEFETGDSLKLTNLVNTVVSNKRDIVSNKGEVNINISHCSLTTTWMLWATHTHLQIHTQTHTHIIHILKNENIIICMDIQYTYLHICYGRPGVGDVGDVFVIYNNEYFQQSIFYIYLYSKIICISG